ncbi:MAG: sugar ABC transporter ATP-binding protein [Acidobacteriota bacterium]|nr:sugar ABC transporter ATP-binding protein [Acidobacteriota bacterium]
MSSSSPGGNSPPETSILSVENLSKSFGSVDALDEVFFSVDPGEIRAICGENGAGKSTLVKILTGVHRPDQGTVRINNQTHNLRHPQAAQQHGIALVAQELSLAPHLSVQDNIWLGNRTVPLFHRRRHLRQQARRVLDIIGLDQLDLDRPADSLTIGERQLVEIARMLARQARVLILDEPTAGLSDVEIDRIFKALKALSSRGTTIIYVTHRLGEVFELCDTVTVLRNGRLVRSCRVTEIDRDGLIELMLGQSMRELYPPSRTSTESPLLVVEDLQISGWVEDFSLSESSGQIVSIAGQISSGAAQVVRAVAGLTYDATGRVRIKGQPVSLGSVRGAQKSGVRFISEDRAREGIFLQLKVLENLIATRLGAGFLSWSALHQLASSLARRVGLDDLRLGARAEELSGGNQQKLALGRSMGQEQQGVFLMNEPTRGVDVGSRRDIYKVMRQLCENGNLIVMTSSDLEEVVGISDIIITMYRSRQVARYARGQVTMHQVLTDITHPRTRLGERKTKS